MASDSSIYRELDRTKSEIRILELQPGQGMDEISCCLRVVSLSSEPHYSAVSYVWGDPNQTVPIRVNNKPFQATLNLCNALRAWRHGESALTLWVDAICINQADMRERGHQVRRMGEIYQKATNVDIWLGDFTERWRDEIPFDTREWDSDRMDPEYQQNWDTATRRMLLAYLGTKSANLRAPEPGLSEADIGLSDGVWLMEIVASRMNLCEMPFHELVLDGNSQEFRLQMRPRWYWSICVFMWLMTRPWWQRVWTIQETVMPTCDATVHVGLVRVPLSLFLGVGASLDSHTEGGTCFHFSFSKHLEDHLACLQNLHELRTACQSGPPALTNLSNSLQLSTQRDAREFHDRLYGILGILFDEPPFEPDYTLSFEQLCCLSTHMMIAVRTDWFWPEQVSGTRSTSLPTWAVDVKNKRLDKSFKFERDPAAATHYRLEFTDGLTAPTLSLTATRVAVVQNRAQPPDPGPCADWQYVYVEIQSWIERALEVAACYGSTARSREFWRAIWQEYLPEESETGYTRTRPSLLDHQGMQKVVKWWQTYRVPRQAASGRHSYITGLEDSAKELLFFATEAGDFGLARRDIQPGDEIFIGQGCHLPLVLRRQLTQSSDDAKPIFMMVGPCHLNDWMDGEAVHDATIWEDVIII